ncbi:MAG: AAA family ATPase [Chloroflexota bacterium]
MKLIIFSGLPGAGKSVLAEAVGRELGIPVFAKDWLEAVLLRSKLVAAETEKQLGSVGYDLLTVLAERQLSLEQSVILDSVASTESIRNVWRDLMKKYNADWRVIECVCSDITIHRNRLEKRQRNIPGWHELKWSDVEHVGSYYAPWDEERLILDSIRPVDENILNALKYCK